MGWLRNLIGGSKEVKLLTLGLDCSGKSTWLEKLKLGEVTNQLPTIGFNVSTVKYRKLSMTIFDVGGQSKIRKLWHHYFEGTNGLVFLVDSNDEARFDSAKEELFKLLSEDQLKDIPTLIYANKQDIVRSKSAYQVGEALCLNSIKTHKWFLQGCSALSGDGVYEGLDWLSNELTKNKKKKRNFVN